MTPLGLLFAALLTLTATAGQLLNLLYVLADEGTLDPAWAIVLAAISALVLVWYAFRATTQNLNAGAALPPPAEADTHVIPISIGGGDLMETIGDAVRTEASPFTVVVPVARTAPQRRVAGIL